MRGKLIVLEGGDGSGKSTQQKLIAEYFKEKGLQVVFTRKPGGTVISDKIREILLDKSHKEMDKKTEFLLYQASEAQVSSEILLPSIEQGKIIVSDRLYHSTIVYQGLVRGIDIDLIKRVNKFITGLTPDLVIILDINPEQGLKRTTEKDRMTDEGLVFHEKVRQGYLKLKEILPEENIVIIDGNQTVEKVFEQIKKEINNILS
jgi:dTMP kinase